jgi:uncharacterized protein YaiI (UPF0178 family)
MVELDFRWDRACPVPTEITGFRKKIRTRITILADFNLIVRNMNCSNLVSSSQFLVSNFQSLVSIEKL